MFMRRLVEAAEAEEGVLHDSPTSYPTPDGRGECMSTPIAQNAVSDAASHRGRAPD